MLAFLCLPLHAQKPLGDGILDLARQITTSASTQQKQRIAVLPFRELDGQSTVLGTYLAEELVTNLFQLGNFKIVERQLLDKVLGELKIQQSGAIDPSTAKAIGRIAAVDAIVTGSITDFESYIAVHCRLIDTTTGEVFGAAQAKITKDEDTKKIMRYVLATSDARPAPQGPAKDAGAVRVTIKSVQRTQNGVMITLELLNRDARQPVLVAINAQPGVNDATRTLLRASISDEHGGSGSITVSGLSGIGYVRAGVHGRWGEAYSANEIVRLLSLRDKLGRDEDDPSDGTSDPSGFVSGYRDPNDHSPPPTFFRYKGNRFISGTMTEIPPGASSTVSMAFENRWLAGEPAAFQCEFVVGQGAGTRSYALHNLTFERIAIPKPKG